MEVIFLLLLVILLISALASGFPVAFALPGSAIITIGAASLFGYLFAGDAGAFFAQGGPMQWINAAITNFRGIYFEVERDTLIAIPLFVFMGIMLQRSKIAEDLLIAMAQLFGPVPGGLGISVVFVGALLAATTGIVGATVIAMGLISLPVMLRNNYNVPLATGTIAASGTLGQIIPPSIVLIILADQLSSATDRAGTLRKQEFMDTTGSSSMPAEFGLTSTSAGEMFLGALFPGLVLVGLYMAYILIYALIKPKAAPPVPYKGKYDREFYKRVVLSLVPPLTLIFVVLGSIVLGVATVNQAGAIGAVGAMVMAGYRLMDGKKGAFTPAIMAIISVVIIGLLLNNFDINIKAAKTTEDVVVIFLALAAVTVFLFAIGWTAWRTYTINDTLGGVMIETAKTTSLVFIILLGAAMLTAAFRAFGGEELVKHFLNGLPGGFITKFLVVMFVIFLLGFFLDFIEIAVVVVPIIAPILLADTSANVTGVWLGVMIGVNMQTSFLTPPFGFALFYLRGVAPATVRTIQMYKGVIPFILLQLAGLAIVGVFPSLVNYLPNRVNLTSETAPPPRNPRLQLCVEEMLFAQYDVKGEALKSAFAAAQTLDISYLPPKQRTALEEGFVAATKTFSLVDRVRQADTALSSYIPDYTPLHREARDIEAKIRRMKAASKKQQELMRRQSGGDSRAMEQEIDSINAAVAELEKTIPENWKASRDGYLKLAKANKDARRKYRRTVDDAYEPLAEVIKIIADADALAAMESQIKALVGIIASKPHKEAAEDIKLVEKSLGAIKGANPIRSGLSKVRRAFRGNTPNPEKAAKELTKALATYASEVTWRKRAASELAAGLNDYDMVIRDTIGLRQQERLSPEQATEVASCRAVHRDISLDF
ncbi:MAG: TRAP transporter large permease subunit [Rhodospirillaceae bacterium]|jgi:tripartite ATP-independent transporter DctM subunit|nr:TRAP transporter large permease subunit [Rhodospirillaceae bacterium]MBT5245376.1 TRAP transporter large permease subunit [Rhodospirillaceae bacterium]MBT5562532.1 TRAP transporter large permease subunit [Rhodospirillaceae bacterium]MBT6242895.1 TRAP transporter large permease subunit [Rhodospirillaceae bacterium]